MKDSLVKIIEQSIPRLLTLLDRNPCGDTSGMFDRDYWHFKTSDFSSASFQMGIGILAKLYSSDTFYSRDTVLINFIEKAISSTEQIQHRDGTFDEWYPGERGWAGPTGYVLSSLCETFQLIEKELAPVIKDKLIKLISKSAISLTRTSEYHTLTNHIAMAWLALVQAKHILNSSDFDSYIDKLKNRILNNFQQDEGWSLEYDGADPGYQSGTLCFISKGLRLISDPELESVALKSLKFISHFAYPDGSVGGAVGSRHTITFFISGLIHWRNNPLGRSLCDHLELGLKNSNVVLPFDLDDHYFIYRLNDFLDSLLNLGLTQVSLVKEPLPFELNKSFFFKKAGLYLLSNENIYLVSSLSRGGVIMVWDLKTGKKVVNDNGVLIRCGQSCYSSLWQGKYQLKKIEGGFEISGTLQEISVQKFNVFTLVFFRIVTLLFCFHIRSAEFIKNIIRGLLIVHKNNSNFFFKRIIFISEKQLTIQTSVDGVQNVDEIFIGGEFWTRYVPQSRHFVLNQLNQKFLSSKISKSSSNITHKSDYEFISS